MINLYQVLGLSAHATDVQIRQALNTHAQTLDPKVIKAVNEWLLNPAVRPNYDAKLHAQEPLFFTPPQPIHHNQPSPEPSFNPYQSPSYDSSADEYYTPYLWNPNKATFIALIFVPVAIYMHALNWQELGEDELAQQSKTLAFIVLAIMFGLVIFEMTTGISLPNATGLIILFAWYFGLGKKQVAYVKDELGDEYERKTWLKPILISIGAFIGFVVTSMALGYIFGLLGFLHPDF